jgi:multisubunit Na+/H+ antiporter MnhF subunit
VIATDWLVAAAVLLVGVLVCGFAAWRRAPFEALVALELASTLATMVLVCLTVGFQRSVYGDVPVIAAVLNWVGGLVYVRFLDRSRA